MPAKRSRTSTRARLLEGALEVFAERGFGAASVEDICEAAGFTRGAFYSNFGSKDELVLALSEATTGQVLEQIETLAERLGDEPRELLDAVLTMLDEAVPDRRRWQLISAEFTLHALRNPDAAKAWAAQRQAFRARLTELVQQIVTANGLELTVDPALFVRLVIALHDGATAESLLEDQPAGTLEHTFLPMVLDAITAERK